MSIPQSRNQRSTSSEIGVRLAPKWPFGFAVLHKTSWAISLAPVVRAAVASLMRTPVWLGLRSGLRPGRARLKIDD